MLNLLNFFEDTTTSTTPVGNNWVTYVILGVLVVGMILLMVIPQRKQKKRAEEMMAELGIGSVGGIVGVVVQLDDTHIWLETGLDDSKTTMQFLRQAIHSIAPDPSSAEAKAEKKEANEEDEIK